MNWKFVFIPVLYLLISKMGWACSTIYCYNDEGVCQGGLRNLKTAILWSNDQNYLLEDINAENIIQGDWKSTAKCLIIPGGADLPYCKKLNGKGNQQIKDYVENGGVYIGFCAGGYYGGNFVDFDRGGDLEVLGERELAFFPGSVCGPILAPYVYNSDEGARIADVSWVDSNLYNVYFNGGGYFVDAHQYHNVTVLAKYTNSEFEQAAIVECYVGQGKAILTGIHPEYSAESLEVEIQEKKPGWKNLEENIVPKLLNRSHIKLFKEIIGRI